jgi:hypothetical protein
MVLQLPGWCPLQQLSRSPHDDLLSDSECHWRIVYNSIEQILSEGKSPVVLSNFECLLGTAWLSDSVMADMIDCLKRGIPQPVCVCVCVYVCVCGVCIGIYIYYIYICMYVNIYGIHICMHVNNNIYRPTSTSELHLMESNCPENLRPTSTSKYWAWRQYPTLTRCPSCV